MFYVRNIQFQPGIIPVKKDSYVEGVVPCPASVNLTFCYFIKLTKGRKHVLKKPIISKFCTNFFVRLHCMENSAIQECLSHSKACCSNGAITIWSWKKKTTCLKFPLTLLLEKLFIVYAMLFMCRAKKKGLLFLSAIYATQIS